LALRLGSTRGSGIGSPWRIRAEKSGARLAACALSLIRLCAFSAANGRLVSSAPRS
jgi:hypothetical protein